MILHACVKDDEWRPGGIPMPHCSTAQPDWTNVGLNVCGATRCCLRIMLQAQRSTYQWHKRQRAVRKTHPSYSSRLQ